jgi:pimeloyl-ACP methyl ester carboxylesterase
VAVLDQVPVNDTRQWVLIRSENATNPVVLFVHGGPGTSQLTLMRKNTQPLEKYFTVVNWDQRRAGKSFSAGRDDEKMTRAQFVEDVLDLSSYLAQRFHKDKILLVGHSWGASSASWQLQGIPTCSLRILASARFQHALCGIERAVVTTLAPFSRKPSTTEAPTPFVPAVTSARWPESPRSKLMP